MPAGDPLTDLRDTFQLDELTLKDYAHWTLSLRPGQATVGTMVLSLRRPCEHLGELTAEEGAELAAVFAAVERALDATYRPAKVNYLALMLVDPQVHFHVLPRYDGAREVGSRSFTDGSWPGPPDVTAKLPLDPDEREEIRSRLAAALG